jgi:hypothetical protein
MPTKRELDAIERIAEQFGPVIDLRRSPGVLIEILRNFGVVIGQNDDGTGGAPPAPPPTPPSSIAIAGPGSGTVTLEDLMRVVLDLRQEVIKLSERVSLKR